MSKTFYRPDIDGLRALAVLPVLLFHANLLLPGGFVGVDVFFVISGYLITQIIERELKERRFSVLVFYQRRIRRIFPALFVMFAVSTLIACFFLPPVELQDFGKSLLASSAFSSNILFFRQSGYFATQAEFKPLLHTWTLSLEEQFYVIWPLLLSVLSIQARLKWKVPTTLFIIFGTFTLSAFLVTTKPDAAFYLLPSRAWELALGALLCFQPISGILARLSRTTASVASLAGILLLVGTVVTYDKLTPFPGFAALLPCLGAALIIAAGEGGESHGGKLLSLRPFVWVGLISYSLYLWHWPILVFGHLIANHKLNEIERSILLAITFLAAWLSWRFVETPFRNPSFGKSASRTWVIAGLIVSALFVAIGAVFVRFDGLPSRGAEVVSLARELESQEKTLQESPCLARAASIPPVDGCLLGIQSPAAEIVLWGDSHAAHLAPALNEVSQRLGVTAREITKAGCPPIPETRIVPLNEMRVGCLEFNQSALAAVLADKRIRVVVLAARWDVFANGELLLSPDGVRSAFSDSRQLFIDKLRKLFATLLESGRKVIVVGQVPLPPSELVSCITRARFNGRDENICSINEFNERETSETLVNEILAVAVAHHESEIQIVHPYNLLCRDRKCEVEADGKLLYIDDSHLSHNGARLLENALENGIASALALPKITRR